MGALLSSNDANGSYTRATLEASPLPLSFTICSALMVEAWTSDFSLADMKMIMNIDGRALDRSQPLFYFVPQEKGLIWRPLWGRKNM